MTKPLISKDFLDVDLAFKAYELDNFTDGQDSKGVDCLINVDFWTLEFKNWITTLRQIPSVIGPKIIREHNYFSIGLVFTDNLSIQKLNAQWRHIDKPTDVLSFPVIDENIISPYDQFVELGDIIVSVDMAQQQAKLHEHSFVSELRWLVSHGFLHLLGWDHPSSKRLKEMLCLQEKLLDTKLLPTLETCITFDQ
ncbi:rRNA maturation RNase YbeY [Prochlorococcus marinus]|uniref:rRNA maturation RNase YbeY n=1 Tax=Prochlorococcus marinus TaxID=1219 RepID=UPI0022B34B04|nr:rRNA maturation RNase YbeY [Prochlorococcus marinus]